MEETEKLALLDESLIRAAEAIGNITPVVMARYYARYPDAAASFEHHGLGKTEQLEGQMVENALYCLMNCIERPAEIEILLVSSVSHHHFTLDVPLSRYQGLMDATIDVIVEQIPSEALAEQALWTEIRGAMAAIFEKCQDDIKDTGWTPPAKAQELLESSAATPAR